MKNDMKNKMNLDETDNAIIDHAVKQNNGEIPRDVFVARYLSARAAISRGDLKTESDALCILTQFMRGTIMLNDGSPTLRDICAVLESKLREKPNGDCIHPTNTDMRINLEDCGRRYSITVRREKPKGK